MWGRELVNKKNQNNTVLFKVGQELTEVNPPLVSDQKLAELFGDFKAHVVGKGGGGEVFRITYKGKDYALKSNAQEAAVMEKLQFTNGVAKIYAMFKLGDKLFMLMEMGKETLGTLNARGERLSANQVIDATKSFEKLIDAQKVLKIRKL